VSLLGIRRQVGRIRRRRAAAVVIALIAASLALHHSAIAVTAHDHHDMGPMAEFCLGVITAVGAVAVAIGFGLLPVSRRAPPRLGACGIAAEAKSPEPRARAGPPTLAILCVFRN
jgi:hypothetical protein